MKSEILKICSGAPWETTVGYSRAIKRGPGIWISGNKAMQDEKDQAPGDRNQQARRCLELIGAALQACGAGWKDVVRTRMYVTDISQWEEVGKAHGEYLSDVRPAATMVEVKGLIHPDLVVEIEVDAWLDEFD